MKPEKILSSDKPFSVLINGILFQVCMSLLRLGIITIFLSDSLVSGYTAAAAFTIFVTQIKFLFGLNGEDAFVEPGLFTTPRVRKN